jgi:NitT/TauT family transport system ATP-binding protein
VAASGERLDVIHRVAFTLRHGEMAAFVGPSGCGKTDDAAHHRGTRCRLCGKGGPAARHARHGVPEPRLLPWRTVDENVRLVAPDVDDAKLTGVVSPRWN